MSYNRVDDETGGGQPQSQPQSQSQPQLQQSQQQQQPQYQQQSQQQQQPQYHHHQQSQQQQQPQYQQQQQQQQPDYAVAQAVPTIPPTPDIVELKHRIRTRHMSLNYNQFVKDAWHLLKPNVCVVWAIFITYVVISRGFSFLWKQVGLSFIDTDGKSLMPKHSGPVQPNRDMNSTSIPMMLWNVFGSIILVFVFSGPFMAGLWNSFFNAMRTMGEIRFSDCFSHFRNRELWAKAGFLGLIIQIVVSLGLMLFLLPGLYLAMAFSFAMQLRAEHAFLTLFDCLSLSMKIFNKYFCSIFAFMLLLVLMQVLGLLMCLFGVLVTIPLAVLSWMFLYHHLVGVNGCPLLPSDMLTQEQAQIVPMVSLQQHQQQQLQQQQQSRQRPVDGTNAV